MTVDLLQPLRVVIVDDEELARLRLRTLLGDCVAPPALVVGELASAMAALQWLGQHPEINRLLADAKADTNALEAPAAHGSHSAHDSNPHAAEPVKHSEPAKPSSDAHAPTAHAEPAHEQPQYPTAHIEAVRAVKHEEAAPAHAPVKTAAAHKTSPH